MYIEPNTIIRILKDCPLDNSYDHTIYFSTPAQQLSYFQGLTKYTLSNQSYQRVNKGSMRVAYKAEDLYDCNYLMFQNSSFGNKWFYAFIKSVEYVNNVTSEITFEIDVMQTWFFDCEIKPCFVERNHVLDDTPFTWFAKEPFAPSDYMVGITGDNDTPEVWLGHMDTFGLSAYITVVATKVPNTDIGQGKVYSGIYSGLWYYSVPVSDYQSINDLIETLDNIGSGNAIVGIYMSPYPVTENGFSREVDTLIINKTNKNFGGYTIKNNKLLQYPFVRIKVKSTDGNEMELKPELINGNTLQGTLWFSTSLPPTITFTPKYGNVVRNWDYAIQYSENPQCAWSSDVYANWQAQNLVAQTMNKISAIGNLASAGATLAVAPTAGAASVLASGKAIQSGASATSPWAQEYQMSVLPGKLGGTPNSGSVNYAFNRVGFEAWAYRAFPYEARMFDEYFDRYGYAINEIRTPNRTGRPHWCYLKTRDIGITGSVPTDDMDKIKTIYNNGITFWNNGNELGDYSLDNTI